VSILYNKIKALSIKIIKNKQKILYFSFILKKLPQFVEYGWGSFADGPQAAEVLFS
jgi:hypothetical protein